MKPGWRIVKFGEVVRNTNLVERDPGAKGIERIVGLEHIDPENLHIRRWNSIGDGTSFTRKFVPGQTLFGKRRAYQRKVAYAEFEGICSGDILTFEPKDRQVLLPELLPFLCQSDAFFDHALDTSAGSLSPRTSWTALKDFEFPLPPLDEQKRIAEILWAADGLIEARQKSLIAAQELISANLREQMTGLLGHSSIKQFRLNQVPSGWKKVVLSDIARIVRGASPRPKGDPRYYGGSVPRVMVEDIIRDKKYVTPSIDFLTSEGAEKSRPMKKGDIVLVCSGGVASVGIPGILQIDACIHDGIIGLVDVSDECKNEWLYYSFIFFQGLLNATATHGGTFVNLTTDIVKGIELALPPIDVQEKLLYRIHVIEDAYQNIMHLVHFDKQLPNTLMRDLLAKDAAHV